MIRRTYLGDAVEIVANKLGGQTISKAITRVTGKPCKCAERKQRLNDFHKRLTKR